MNYLKRSLVSNKMKKIYITLVRSGIIAITAFLATRPFRNIGKSTVSLFHLELEVTIMAFVIAFLIDLKWKPSSISLILMSFLMTILFHGILVAILISPKGLLINGISFNIGWHFLGLSFIWKETLLSLLIGYVILCVFNKINNNLH